MKIRTTNQLQDALDREIGWRNKEIAELKLASRASASMSKPTVIRAGVAMLYAHWEGFIKNASVHYVNYVSNQGLRYSELRPCFAALGFKSQLGMLRDSNRSSMNAAAIETILAGYNSVAKISPDSSVSVESNLTSIVFRNIANSVGIDTGPYEPKYHLIDESLVGRRNRIAHGEYLDVNDSDWRALADEIILIMRWYKGDVQNGASLKRYRR